MFVFWLFNWQEPLVALPVTLVIATVSYYKIEKPLRTAYRNRRARPGCDRTRRPWWRFNRRLRRSSFQYSRRTESLAVRP